MLTKNKKKHITSDELDRIFDEGEEDIMQYADMESIRTVNPKAKRVNVDFPNWMIQSLDREAKHIGVPRQALIKMWIADRLNLNAQQVPK